MDEFNLVKLREHTHEPYWRARRPLENKPAPTAGEDEKKAEDEDEEEELGGSGGSPESVTSAEDVVEKGKEDEDEEEEESRECGTTVVNPEEPATPDSLEMPETPTSSSTAAMTPRTASRFPGSPERFYVYTR